MTYIVISLCVFREINNLVRVLTLCYGSRKTPEVAQYVCVNGLTLRYAHLTLRLQCESERAQKFIVNVLYRKVQGILLAFRPLTVRRPSIVMCSRSNEKH